MTNAHLYAEFFVNMFCQMLCAINRPVLTTRAAEGEHQTSEATLNVTTHMGIGQLIHTVQEGQNLTVVLQETDDRFVKSSELLIRLVAAGVMR